MLFIEVANGKYELVREIDKNIEILGTFSTMKEAQDALEEEESKNG